MLGYALEVAGAAIMLLLAGVVAIVIFGNVWARIGIGTAVVGCGGLLLLAWNVDRKDRTNRAGLQGLPTV